jgi:hypothetical protein
MSGLYEEINLVRPQTTRIEFYCIPGISRAMLGYDNSNMNKVALTLKGLIAGKAVTHIPTSGSCVGSWTSSRVGET